MLFPVKASGVKVPKNWNTDDTDQTDLHRWAFISGGILNSGAGIIGGRFSTIMAHLRRWKAQTTNYQKTTHLFDVGICIFV